MCCCVSNLLRNRARMGRCRKTMLQLTESRAKRSQFCRFLSSSWETDREPSPSARVALQRTLGVASFFYFVINIWWPVISVWKSFAWKSISISRDMWNKKEMRNRILLSSGHPFPKSRLRRIGSIPFSFFFKFLSTREWKMGEYTICNYKFFYINQFSFICHTKFRIKAKILIWFEYGGTRPSSSNLNELAQSMLRLKNELAF